MHLWSLRTRLKNKDICAFPFMLLFFLHSTLYISISPIQLSLSLFFFYTQQSLLSPCFFLALCFSQLFFLMQCYAVSHCSDLHGKVCSGVCGMCDVGAREGHSRTPPQLVPAGLPLLTSCQCLGHSVGLLTCNVSLLHSILLAGTDDLPVETYQLCSLPGAGWQLWSTPCSQG